jgi:hypothetical protein
VRQRTHELSPAAQGFQCCDEGEPLDIRGSRCLSQAAQGFQCCDTVNAP